MKNLFDRPTKKELINALHYFFLEEIDLNDLKETSNFKLRIALNVFKILRREINNEEELIRKFEELSLKLLKKKIYSKEELSMIIKDESYDDSLMETFLFELASEKLKVDNPTYLKD